MSAPLSPRDANVHLAAQQNQQKLRGDVLDDSDSVEYHRQMLANKLAGQKNGLSSGGTQPYISPSDEIMSPCTAKLNALRNKKMDKAKPRSLFQKASAKSLETDGGLFDSKAMPSPGGSKSDPEMP